MPSEKQLKEMKCMMKDLKPASKKVKDLKRKVEELLPIRDETLQILQETIEDLNEHHFNVSIAKVSRFHEALSKDNYIRIYIYTPCLCTMFSSRLLETVFHWLGME